MTREEDIRQAVDVMRRGGVILYPTDTVWGIGCDATNAEAVARVYQIKQRSDAKALICLVDSDARLQRYFRQVPDVAWQIIDSLKEDQPAPGPRSPKPAAESPRGPKPAAESPRSPKPAAAAKAPAARPTTLILDGAVNLAPNLIAADGSVGIRITQEPFSRELCYRFQKAVVSTSANISGEPAAQNFQDIDPRILEAVDYACQSRRQEHQPHQPSAIIRLRQDGEVEIIRR